MDRTRRFAALIAGFLAIWAFIAFVLPLARSIPGVSTFADYVGESEIEAGALWYTEVEAVSISERHCLEAVRHPVPSRPLK